MTALLELNSCFHEVIAGLDPNHSISANAINNLKYLAQAVMKIQNKVFRRINEDFGRLEDIKQKLLFYIPLIIGVSTLAILVGAYCIGKFENDKEEELQWKYNSGIVLTALGVLGLALSLVNITTTGQFISNLQASYRNRNVDAIIAYSAYSNLPKAESVIS